MRRSSPPDREIHQSIITLTHYPCDANSWARWHRRTESSLPNRTLRSWNVGGRATKISGRTSGLNIRSLGLG
jgi:hypothetical protein